MIAGVLALLLTVSTAVAPTPALPLAATPAQCSVSSWEMTWGFKESFRAYLSGAIATGEWSTSGNISYATPSFTVQGTDGLVRADSSAGELSTEGSIRFLGHSGLLDQVVSQPRVVWSGNSGAVYLAVEGLTQEGVDISSPQVEFVEVTWENPDVTDEGALLTLRSKEVTLTAQGAAAFGTYPEGEAFDPIEISIQLEPGCLQPAPLISPWLGGLAGGLVIVALAAIGLVRKWRGQERRGLEES